jgi:hypothetical protein
MYTCRLKKGSEKAAVLQAATVLIWDEAPMCHKHNFEAVDRTLRDFMGVDVPFGGKVMLFGGDFRQVLPVVRRGTRSDIEAASLSKATFWSRVCVKRLSINMRVRTLQAAGAQQEAQAGQDFADFLLRVGDGAEQTYPEIGEDIIRLPRNMCASSDSLPDLVSTVLFPAGVLCPGAAILVARNNEVDDINKLAMGRFPGQVLPFAFPLLFAHAC